ncbi:hypothetical protein BC832DRAFT_594551 [Gaertneriomyces semiglobifer]|nr:hypothetical protein BC832DRAFT_594551 [Gaertneriomyces semiglobifer]
MALFDHDSEIYSTDPEGERTDDVTSTTVRRVAPLLPGHSMEESTADDGIPDVRIYSSGAPVFGTVEYERCIVEFSDAVAEAEAVRVADGDFGIIHVDYYSTARVHFAGKEHPLDGDPARVLGAVLLQAAKRFIATGVPLNIQNVQDDFFRVVEQIGTLYESAAVMPTAKGWLQAVPAGYTGILGKEFADQLLFLQTYYSWTDSEHRRREAEKRRVQKAIDRGDLPAPPGYLTKRDQEKWERNHLRQAQWRVEQNLVREHLEAAREQTAALRELVQTVLTGRETLTASVSHRGVVSKSDGHSARYAKYSGPKYQISLNIFHWLRTFERICQREGITTDHDKMNYLRKALDPSELRVWDWYSAIDFDHMPWSDIRSSMIVHFTSETQRHPSTLWTKLSQLRKSSTESIQTFQQTSQQALLDLQDANAISAVPFLPTNHQMATAWWAALGDRDVNVLAMGIDVDSRIEDVISRTVAQYDRLESIRACDRSIGNPRSAAGDRPIKPVAPKFSGTAPTVMAKTTTTTAFTSDKRSSNPPNQRPYQNNRVSTPPTQSRFRSATPTNSSGNQGKPTSQGAARTTTAPTKDEVATLTDKLQKMSIKLGSQPTQFDVSQATCYRCGDTGHISRNCESEAVLPTWRGYLLMSGDNEDQPELEYHPGLEQAYARVFQLAYHETDVDSDGDDVDNTEDF